MCGKLTLGLFGGLAGAKNQDIDAESSISIHELGTSVSYVSEVSIDTAIGGADLIVVQDATNPEGHSADAAHKIVRTVTLFDSSGLEFGTAPTAIWRRRLVG